MNRCSRSRRCGRPVGLPAPCLDGEGCPLAPPESRSARDERESLLREIRHRVMNTLQVLSSLIGLESEGARGDAAALLRELDGRVQSMALVHEAIRPSESGDEVDFKRYVELYCDRFADSSVGRGAPLRIVRGADDAVLPIGKALPFGLILNELVSRTAARLARVEAKGAIRVELRSTRGGKALRLSVVGGAGGAPGAPADLAALGTRLVDGLAGQLRAALAESADGSSVSVEFSLE